MTYLPTPTKTASVPFDASGLYVGTVTRSDSTLWRVWVQIPRYFGDAEFGPSFVASATLPEVGQKVVCMFLEGKSETLAVLGPVSMQAVQYTSFRYIDTGVFPDDPTVTPLVVDRSDGSLWYYRSGVWKEILAVGDVTTDADTLDGLDSTYFLNVGNMTAGTLVVARGGTGAGSFTAGRYLKGNGTSAFTEQAAPIPVADGGSGAVSFTAGSYLKGNGTSAFTVQATPIPVADGGSGAVSFTAGTYLKGNGTSAFTEQAAPIPVADGGTAIASYAVGDIIYASGTTTISKLAAVATGNALISGGVTTAPSWGKIGLTTHVSGTLAATNGGTDQSSYVIGDILYASTNSALSRLADAATGNALITGGAGVAPSYGKIGLTTHISGTLGVGNGGTGQTTLASGEFLKGNGGSGITSQSGIDYSDIQQDAWSTWSPTLTGITLGTGSTTEYYYTRLGNIIFFELKIILGTGGSTTGQWSYTLPVTPGSLRRVFANGYIFDDSGDDYYDIVSFNRDSTGTDQGATMLGYRSYDYLSGAVNSNKFLDVSTSGPVALAVSDVISQVGFYRA